MQHPTALVESDEIGLETNVWAYAHVMKGAVVGSRVNIGDHAFIESGAQIGSNVTIKNAVLIWDGIQIEDDVFIGPRVVFTNDRAPRSPRMPSVAPRYAAKENWLESTIVRQGSSIGAGAVICPGIEIGPYATIGAGAVVTKNVPPHALVLGTPATQVGDVCTCGQRLTDRFDVAECTTCGEEAATRLQRLEELHPQTSSL